MPKPQSERRGGRPWARRRLQVLRRDGHQCVRCGAGGVALEADHVVPVAQGGSDELDNLQTLCKPCHADRTYGPTDPRIDGWDELIARRWGL